MSIFARKICRICRINSELVPIVEFNVHNKELTILKKLQTLNLNIKENDGLPQHICFNCIQLLNISFKFIETSKKSEQIFLNDLLKYSDSSVALESDDPENFASEKTQNTHLNMHLKHEDLSPSKSCLDQSPYLDRSENEFSYCDIYNKSISLTEADIADSEVKLKAKLFICGYCKRKFTFKNSMVRHLRSHLNAKSSKDEKQIDDTKHYCKILNEGTKPCLENEAFLPDLKMNDRDRPFFICAHCQVRFRNKKSLIHHIRKNHAISELNDRKLYECNICYQAFAQLELLDTHMEEHSKVKESIPGVIKSKLSYKLGASKKCKTEDALFVCANCGVKCVHKTSLRRHMLQFHLNTKSSTAKKMCTLCNKTYLSNSSLNRHIVFHKQRGEMIPKNESDSSKPPTVDLECQFCGKPFKFGSRLQLHVQTCHKKSNFADVQVVAENPGEDNTNTYECAVCGKRLLKWSTFNRHMKEHLKKGKTIPTQFSLDRSNSLTGKAEFQCPCCGMCFKTEFFFVSHTKKYHSNLEIADYQKIKSWKTKPRSCSACNKTFSTVYIFKRHLQTVHAKQRDFLCLLCGKSFSENCTLKAHLKCHNAERETFSCTLCTKTYQTKSGLYIHNKNDHDKKKPYACDFKGCNAKYSVPSSLKYHKRIHTGEKPYKCDHCPMRFKDNNQRVNHHRTHTGERPFKCLHENCEKAFAQRYDLTKHSTIHTGEKRYVCHCGEAFRLASSLKLHTYHIH